MKHPTPIALTAVLLFGGVSAAQLNDQRGSVTALGAVDPPAGEFEPAVPGGPRSGQSDPRLGTDALLGSRLIGRQDEGLGRIVGLRLHHDGRVDAVVASIGGFLGIGDEKVELPWEAIEWRPGENAAVVGLDRGQLERAAAFQSRKAGR